jgi:transcriptional regulator with XRE-family HTH domain
MDMKINSEVLRQQRERRAWTQSQLADVAGLSMRTVQRIERSGSSAKESAMALASALDLELTDLLIQPTLTNRLTPYLHRWGVAGTLAALLIALGWWSTASAEQVMISLSVKAESGARTLGDLQFLNELGRPSEVKFDQQFRLMVTAKREAQHLLVSTEVYDFIDGEYQLISTPAILVADNEQAAIHLNTQSSGLLELDFRSDF